MRTTTTTTTITTTVFQMLVRVCGLVQIVLGLLFWTNNARTLVPVHMLVGSLLVLSLWVLAVLAAVSGVNPGFVALAILWGLITLALGLTQTRLLPGSAHWVIQVLHLLVGLGAIGQGESLARRIKDTPKLAVRA
jgi:hypothetical protein